MNDSDAKALTAKLAAAYPRDWVGQATYEVYAEMIGELKNPVQALEAVNGLIREGNRLPPVAQVRDAYRRLADKYAAPALPEPELTEAQRQENVRMARELLDHVTRGVPDVDGEMPVVRDTSGREG